VVTDLKYPPYLDRFDRHGWGFYGFNGNWGKPSASGEDSTDPVADMDFLAKYKFRFELWPAPADFDDNYSVLRKPHPRLAADEAEKLGVPVSARLYGNLPHVKEFTDLRDVEAPFMEGGWYWAILGYRDFPRQSWFSVPGRLYMARQAKDEIKMYAGHPEIESWMMPYGGNRHLRLVTLITAMSPPPRSTTGARPSRRKLRLGLDELSAMYNRKDHPFKSSPKLRCRGGHFRRPARHGAGPGKANGISGPSRIRTKGSRANGGTPT